MSRIKSSSLLLFLVLTFYACNKGRQDPLGPDPESGLTEGRREALLPRDAPGDHGFDLVGGEDAAHTVGGGPFLVACHCAQVMIEADSRNECHLRLPPFLERAFAPFLTAFFDVFLAAVVGSALGRLRTASTL